MQTRCPHCGKPAIFSSANSWRPFCSERCKLIDLGDWIEEKNRIEDDTSGFGEPSDNIQKFKH